MKKVLIVGMNPYTIDFTQPGFAPGLTAEKVEIGLKAEREKLRGLGYESDMHLVDTGVLEQETLATLLKQKQFDGIMIGAGVRLPPSNFTLFEKIINTVHEFAPKSKIIFNTNPMDTAEAISRWV